MSLLALFFTLSTNVGAVTLEGFDFPDKTNVAKKELVLNGTGYRTATIFKVKVYAAGLYLPKKADTSDAVLSQPAPKQLKMIFLRDVDVKSAREAWHESFEKNCGAQCDALRPSLSKLQDLMQDMKRGDSVTYTFEDETLSVSVNGEEKGRIRAKSFPRMILSTWLGEHPPSEGLREGLLGKS